MAQFRELNAGAFGALGGGDAIVATDGSDQRFGGGEGKLCFESPPSHALQDNYVNERYRQ